MNGEEICLEVCGSCTQEEIWKDKDCKVCHRNMLQAIVIARKDEREKNIKILADKGLLIIDEVKITRYSFEK